MEELREIATSYYKAGSSEVKDKAKYFFESMDVDRDGRVNMEEFLRFMQHEGFTHMRNNDFFKILDRHGNGRLGFTDVMTLYYIIKSGRPFCDCCSRFIPGVFFSCVRCYNSSRRFSFNICHPCHKSRSSQHRHHDRRAFFLDNYTLLQTITTNGTGTTKVSASTSKSTADVHRSVSTGSNHRRSKTPNRDDIHRRSKTLNRDDIHRRSKTPNRDDTSNAIVPVPPRDRIRQAHKIFEASLFLGNVFTSLATVCTIM